MTKQNSLIIGAGEVGKGLQKILKCAIINKGEEKNRTFKIIHICIPWSENFIKYVNQYKDKYKPKYTVIHSTVPVGTSNKLNAIHSPIRGVHPHLDKGIKTFVKYFGGHNACDVAKEFKKLGVKTYVTPNSRDTEALKLWDTTQYGAMILLNKEIKNWCDENDVDFSVVYTHANETYNKGYAKLGRKEVIRPVLKYTEGKIGGHCVGNNVHLFRSKTAEEIKKYQKKYAV